MQKKTRIHRCLMPALLIMAVLLCACYPNAISRTGGLGIEGGSLGLTIWASRNCDPLDTPVHLRTTVQNQTSARQVVQAKDKPVFDLEVTYDGKTYRWSEGKPLTPDLTRLELQPNQSKTIDMDWVAESKTSVGIVSAIFFYSKEASANQVARVSIYLEPACPVPLGS